MQQEQELFENYELKGWGRSARIYKILGASTLVSLLSLFVIGQTQLLTTKGCDSPFVGKVCNVLDTLYVGGNVLATDAGYVDKDYVPNELVDADITFINVADQFKYPEGYFALSNPELVNQQLDQNNPFPSDGYLPNGTGAIPGIPNPTIGGTGDLLSKQQELPPTNPNAVIGNLPTSPLGTDNPTITSPKVTRPNKWRPIKPKNPTINNTSPDKLPKIDTQTTAENKEPKTDPNQPPLKTDPVKEPEINKKPLKDFAANVKAKYEKKEVDLTKPFSVIAEGVIASDGKLDTSVDPKTKQPRSRFIKWEGDDQMVEVAKQAFEAVGSSGWLVYLRNQGIEKINFTIVQDNDNLKVLITSELPTPERAGTVTSGLNGIIQAALLLDRNGLKKLGDDEKVLLNSAKPLVNGKQFVLNFELPKQIAQEMITRKLNEPPAPEENKPQGTAQMKENNKAASE